jgi:hypothetical protein
MQSTLCELSQYNLQNRQFTWSNEREEAILVRLDRCFCNKEFDLILLDHNLITLSSSLSDHCHILLCQQARPRVRDTFRFENFWPRVLGFTEIVQQAWRCDVLGISPLNTPFYKLQNTAKALRSWSKKVFGNARLELHMVNEIIQRLDLAQENRQLTPEERALRSDLKNKVLGLAAIE